MLNNDYGVHGNMKLDNIFMVSEKMIATNNSRRKESARSEERRVGKECRL